MSPLNSLTNIHTYDMESHRNTKKRGTMKTLSELSKILCIGIAFFGVTAIGNAQTTLTFDDYSTGGYLYGVGITNGYGGLNWNNFFVYNTPATFGLDYANGVVSSPNDAGNSMDGSPASISSSSAFTFDSAYFMAIGGGNGYLTVYGFSGGTQVYDTSYYIPPNAPALFTFDYANVDTVEFVSAADVPFTMDNMTITVPEPSTCALASLAVVFGGLMSWRKKSRREQ